MVSKENNGENELWQKNIKTNRQAIKEMLLMDSKKDNIHNRIIGRHTPIQNKMYGYFPTGRK